MASILSFASRIFRTRDPSRDTATDRERLLNVRSAILAAIESAERERSGLKQRVDDYFASASHILDQGDYEQRSEEDEAVVVKAEQQGAAGLRRIADLNAQIVRLQNVLDFFDDEDTPAPEQAVHQ